MYFFYENKEGELRVDYANRLEFGAHLHNHIEVIFMLEGKARAYVDAREHQFQKGDVFLVFPNQIHQYEKNETEEECYIICIFSPELCPEFKSIFRKKIPVDPVVRSIGRDDKLAGLFHSLVAFHKNEGTYRDTLLKGGILVMLSALFERMEFENIRSSDSNTIKDVLNYCTANYNQDISLEMVADELHVSKYYISHLFAQKLHMGFHEYISTLRISEACRLLSGQESSVTDIAYIVGFNSTRSFNRAFLKYTNMTPSQYRKRELE